MNLENLSFTLLVLFLIFGYLYVVFLHQTFISSRFPFHTLSEMFVPQPFISSCFSFHTLRDRNVPPANAQTERTGAQCSRFS